MNVWIMQVLEYKMKLGVYLQSDELRFNGLALEPEFKKNSVLWIKLFVSYVIECTHQNTEQKYSKTLIGCNCPNPVL